MTLRTRMLILLVSALLAGYVAAPSFAYNTLLGRYGKGTYETYTAYVPTTAATPRAAVVFVHGNSAEPSMWAMDAKEVANQGAIAITIDYNWRLVYPGALQEVGRAVDYFRARSTWKVDPSRVGVVGSSGGAFIAAQLGFGPNSRHPAAIVGWSGGYDLPKLQSSLDIRAAMPCGLAACPSTWIEASAALQPADTAAVHLANGSAEQMPVDQATELDAHAADLGLVHSLDVWPTQLHGIKLQRFEWPSTRDFLRAALSY
jgi:acetyl esterase/lipase